MKRKDVVILDLGLGNLHSVARAFERASATPSITSDPEAVVAAPRIVVPGQGAIRQCSIALSGALGEALRSAIAKGTPYLGICLGMQALFERSEEAPGVPGLGLFRGEVKKFPADLRDDEQRPLKIPHMGWNQVKTKHPYLVDGGWYYFVHSYYCVPEDPSLVSGTTDYGQPFCSAIARENVFACQFHPEKSDRLGAALIERYLEA